MSYVSREQCRKLSINPDALQHYGDKAQLMFKGSVARLSDAVNNVYTFGCVRRALDANESKLSSSGKDFVVEVKRMAHDVIELDTQVDTFWKKISLFNREMSRPIPTPVSSIDPAFTMYKQLCDAHRTDFNKIYAEMQVPVRVLKDFNTRALGILKEHGINFNKYPPKFIAVVAVIGGVWRGASQLLTQTRADTPV